MPTTAKLAAALALAALGCVSTLLALPHLPDRQEVGWAVVGNTLLGALAGWRLLGPRTGGGMLAAASAGITAMLAALLLAVLVWSGQEMLLRAFRLRYAGPLDALGDLVGVALELARVGLVPAVAATLLVGGALAGMLSEAVARRWS